MLKGGKLINERDEDMKLRTALIAATAAIFLVSSTAWAATERDVTARLAGKIGDLFKINGGLRVTKNAAIDGKLTVNKRNVTGTKKYIGHFDTAANGDFVSTMTYPYDCTVPQYSVYTTTVATHYKRLSLAEIKTASMPDARLYYKVNVPTAPIPATYSPSVYPNDNNVWASGTAYFAAGKMFFAYKTVNTTCAGTATSSITTTGDYQVVVN